MRAPPRDYLDMLHRLQTDVVAVEHAVVVDDGRGNRPDLEGVAPGMDLGVRIRFGTHHRETQLRVRLHVELRDSVVVAADGIDGLLRRTMIRA